MNRRARICNQLSTGVRLILTIGVCQLFITSSANAVCDYDTSPIHRHCQYYVATYSQALDVCNQKAAELHAEGYQAGGCGGNGSSTAGAGWFTRDIYNNKKYPFQLIAVFSGFSCDRTIDLETGLCSPPKDHGCGVNGVGNPCNVATGNKYQKQTDIVSGISFIRSYNSQSSIPTSMGIGWRHNHQKVLILGVDSLTSVSETGRGDPWIKVNGVWQGDPDTEIQIAENSSGFVLTKSNGETETYDTSGMLLLTIDANGHQTVYAYNSENQLETVTNQYGQSLSFTHVDGKIDTVTDSLGEVYTYEYDANSNLSAVSLPDLTPNDPLDNPRKVYHYENSVFPNHLTGISDENGDRYGTYAYDANGKAISTEHAKTTNSVGQQYFGLDY